MSEERSKCHSTLTQSAFVRSVLSAILRGSLTLKTGLGERERGQREIHRPTDRPALSVTLDSDKEGGRLTAYLSVHYLLNAKDRDGEERNGRRSRSQSDSST